MLSILFILLLYFDQLSLSISRIDNFDEPKGKEIVIEPGLSETYFINSEEVTNFAFNINGQDTVQVNIHSINCNFDLYFSGKLINLINLDTYSFIINSENKIISVIPLLDVIDGQYKENYKEKSCPLSINSYLINDRQPQIKIENKEEKIFYLDPSKYDLLNIIYNIKEISFDSFSTLCFQFDENAHFFINIIYKSNKKEKDIYNATNLYLNSEFFFFDNDTHDINETIEGGTLNIIIENKDKRYINMHFKIIEKDTISLLEKDSLTFGFLTSKTTYQYYYTQIFKGEEGELMLHNKVLYGVLYGKIVEQKDITLEDLKTKTSFYPKQSTSSDISYHPHLLKLNFSYIDTSHCFNGCYLLITYEQKRNEGDYPLIGYEYTILSRFWNYTDYNSKIVDIPYNEYLIGSFERGSISHHYYSIWVPDEAEKLIIQIRGNYLDGFYGEGRIKINTMKTVSKTSDLKIINPEEVITLNIKNLNLQEKRISFTFRPKDYFVDVFSFYYFRVLYAKENDIVYFSIDSYFGNLCKPEIDYSTNLSYCYFIYENKYNGSLTKFALTSTTQNEYYKIYSTKYFKNTKSDNETEFLFLDTELKNDVDFYLFKLEFPNDEIKDIKSSFTDTIEELYPQIYTMQMFYISNVSLLSKTNYFSNLVNNYTLKYQYVNGNGGKVNVSLLNFQVFSSSRNFKGKPLEFPLESDTTNVTCLTENKNYVYFLELIYNMKNKGVKEVKSGETISNFINGGHFPLYYYLKIKNEKYINVDINIRLNSYNDSLLHNEFTINGYVFNEEIIKRKINGEFINLINPIKGNYSDAFKLGLLQINRKIEDNNNYILIEIINDGNINIDSFMLLEIVTKEYNDDEYFLPVNQYIFETFDGENDEIRTENKYYLSSKEKGGDLALLEISSGYPEIKIEFENKTNAGYKFEYFRGFNKYRVKNATNDNVYFKVVNPNKRKGVNYMIRYYYTGLDKKDKYVIDLNAHREVLSINDENVTISLTFKAIKVNFNYNVTNVKIHFFIHGKLFQYDKSIDEQLNTTSFLVEQIPKFANKTIHNFNYYEPENWTIVFKDIPRTGNLTYDFQLQINSLIENNIFNEEFMILTSVIDLKDLEFIKIMDYTWIIVGSVLGVIVIALVIFFAIKYKKLKSNNVNLEEDLKSMAYTNDVQKNVLIKEKEKSKKDSDYDSTFI